MSHQHYLLLHKSEWERLKRPNNFNQNTDTSREEYFKALDNKSQSWLKKWPDTIQGVVYHVDKRKAELKEKEKKILATYLSGKKDIEKLVLEDRAEAIKRAKELIFEDSSYGRQLISVLRESKAIEERDAQIDFHAKLKAQKDLPADNKGKGIAILTDEDRENNKIKEMKEKVKQIALFNREMHAMKIEQDNKTKREEVEQYLQYNDIIKTIQEDENKQAARECFERKDNDDFVAQQKQIKELRKIREKYDDKIVELWRTHADKVRNKQKLVFDKIHKERYNTPGSLKLYSMLENIQNEEKRKYYNFVEKGIIKSLELDKLREYENGKQLMVERQKRRLIDDDNKKQMYWQHQQTNSDKTCTESVDSKIKEPKKTRVLKNEKLNSNSTPFTTQQNKLLRELRRREKEPSPWSGSAAAHAQFFLHANKTMKECRYKTNIQKIINGYIKENNLDTNIAKS